MSGQGIAQILFYCVVLVALGYPLGIFMARAYSREKLDPVERGFLRLLGRGSGDEQDWKSYAKTVLDLQRRLQCSCSTRSSGSRVICS